MKGLLFFFEGLKGSVGNILKPKYDKISHSSYYEINESSKYFFEFSTFFQIEEPSFLVKLLSDEKIFYTPNVYESRIEARYDEESWPLISSFLDKDIKWTLIYFKTEFKAKSDSKVDPLNLYISFPIKIKRKIFFRIVDFFSDIGFGIGTGAIALSKILEKWTWWYWIVIVGYFVWATCKLIIKFWRV